MKNNYKRNIGSVSHGTMRPEDLVPSFVWELKQMKPLQRAHAKLVREIEQRIESEQEFGDDDLGITDNATDDLESLFDALGCYALPGFYFGAHPGDGSDYGFWLDESFMEDFDGLKVSDTSEVPKSYRGEVLHVNDHGNASLYVASRGRLREVWALV